MNELTIPSNKELAKALAAVVDHNAVQTGDAAFMKFAKGEWIYGSDEAEVAKDSQWAVNPHSFRHGYVIWEDEELAEEVLVKLGEPCPATPSKGNYQVGFEMKCLHGPDKGVQVVFKTSSKGGTRAVLKLIKAISIQAAQGADVVPVVQLTEESYKHKQYGKVYTPVFNVVRWTDMGLPVQAPQGADRPTHEDIADEDIPVAPVDEPRRRRRA